VSLVLPFTAWPAADTALWDALVRIGGPLDDRGSLSHLRETSRETLRNHYGRWLAWILATDPDALSTVPVDRVTLDRLRLWLADLAHTRPMTRLAFVGNVLRVVCLAEPEQDWRAHMRLKAVLRRIAGPGDRNRKQGRVVSSRLLFEAGVRHATVDAAAATTTLEAMKRRRNGTMVAVLALIPMRRRAYVRLELGSSLLVQQDRVVISLPEHLTKNGLPWRCEVPEAVTSLLLAYLAEVRPWFLASKALSHNTLWVGDRGAPFADDHFGIKIGDITTRLIGVRVSPHLFRDAAATSLARHSPQAAKLIRPVLSHTSFGTAERHYIQANSLEAGRNHAALIRTLKRKRL